MSDREDEVEQDLEEDLEGDETEGESVSAIDEVDEIDIDDDSREDLRAVDEALSQKDQNARSLAIRRAIEARNEEKRLNTDLDYLDLDD